MKQIPSSAPFCVPVLRLAICALLIASANQSVKASEPKSSNPSGAIFATSAADGGRLLIKRSPILGHDISITVTIDGKPGGWFGWGHTYERYLTPGRHVLIAAPDRDGGPWKTTLNVRAGETYAYSASYNVNRLILTPTTAR